jgi:hypothetical protein
MKTTIHLNQFLRTGKFGTVEFGDSMQTVVEKLGVADGTLNLGKGLKGLHYSRYEFVFDPEELFSIQNDHFKPEYPQLMEFENDTVRIDPGILRADAVKTPQDIAHRLRELDIAFARVKYFDRVALKTMGNVILDFDDEKWSDEEGDWGKIEPEENRPLIGIRFAEAQKTTVG